jgi:hypothetical protein
MALTITRVVTKRGVGSRKNVVADLTFDSSYDDNGESLTAADVGMRKLEEVIPHGPFRKSDGSDAVLVSYDHTNSKLVAFRGKDPANAGGADVPFPEVANTTNLGSYSGRVTFVGR